MNLFLTKEALYRLSYVGDTVSAETSKDVNDRQEGKGGAGDEVRTRDFQLGRLELYQLSYSRLNALPCTCCGFSGMHTL